MRNEKIASRQGESRPVAVMNMLPRVQKKGVVVIRHGDGAINDNRVPLRNESDVDTRPITLLCSSP